jgi:predicted deacetylase
LPVHVSIHDVSPLWADEVERALSFCATAGVRAALLVVPNFHGEASLLDDRALCERLRGLQDAGHEILLHGFFHESRGHPTSPGRAPAPRTLRWYVAQRLVSHGEAELLDVSADEGRARIVDGERVLRDAGLRIDGYVAPAWSMPDWLLPLLAARGCRFTEDHRRIYDPAGHRRRASILLNWASRSPARLLSTVAWCRAAKHGRAVFPVRIAIHPADMRFALLRREVAALLQWACGDFVQRTADLFD